jgi:hypothetical protein
VRGLSTALALRSRNRGSLALLQETGTLHRGTRRRGPRDGERPFGTARRGLRMTLIGAGPVANGSPWLLAGVSPLCATGDLGDT